MSLNRAMALLFVLFAAGSHVGKAQSAAAALGLSLAWQSATRLDPAARFTSPWITVRGDLSISRAGLATPFVAGDGRLDLVGDSPAWHGFEVSTDAHVDRFAAPNLFPATTLGHVESAVSYRSGESGAWLGLAVDRTAFADSVGDQPTMTAGVWRQFHGLTLSLGTATHAFRLGGRAPTILPARDTQVVDSLDRTKTITKRLAPTVTDSGAPSHLSRWSDLTARLSWARGLVAFDATAGLSPKMGATPATVWSYATATVALTSRLSLLAAGGVDGSEAWIRVPSSHFIDLGVRISPATLARPEPPPHLRPAAAAFAIRPDDGNYVVSIRVPSARSVELSGDFNGWHALRLREVRPDVWEATLALSPGTHRVNIRVNGDAWTAPPGLASTNDEFNGTVGLLVVP